MIAKHALQEYKCTINIIIEFASILFEKEVKLFFKGILIIEMKSVVTFFLNNVNVSMIHFVRRSLILSIWDSTPVMKLCIGNFIKL